MYLHESSLKTKVYILDLAFYRESLIINFKRLVSGL